MFPEKSDELEIDIEVIARLEAINPFDFFVEEAAEHFPFEYPEDLADSLVPYLAKEPASALFENWLKPFLEVKKENTTQFIFDVNAQLASDIQYNIRMEPGVQTCDETLEKKTGSCRDSAWLLVQLFRHLGLASRFVSGYLVQLKADEITRWSIGSRLYRSARLDRSVCAGAGWIGVDPTSGLFAGEGTSRLLLRRHGYCRGNHRRDGPLRSRIFI